MITIIILTAILAVLLASVYQKMKSLPPGPIPFPLLGNIPQLALLQKRHGNIVNVMKELKKKYGPVFTLWMGPDPTVHVCNLELAQEAMVKRGHEFTDRWNPQLWTDQTKGLGIVNSNGPFWSEHRRFMLHTFRNFGLGRGIMEDRIMMEYNLRMQELNKKLAGVQSEIEAFPFIELMVGSIINRILLNERLEADKEKEFFKLKENLAELNDFCIIDFYAGYKWLWNIPYLRKRWESWPTMFDEMREFLRSQIRERLRAIESGDHVIGENPEDYVDSFLTKMKEEENNPDSIYTEETLVYNLADLWTAGQDTTSMSLLSGFTHMLNQPEIMVEARKELVKVTENKRQLSLTDKKSTPYLNALITETQRHASIVLFNLFRQTKGAVEVGGHPVAAGTPITAEVSVIMENDDLFNNNTSFDPSRYLKSQDLEKHVNPFGLGKRSCPGESLARAELYLLLGNLLLDYEFERVGNEKLSDFEFPDSVFKSPPKFNMKVRKIEKVL